MYFRVGYPMGMEMTSENPLEYRYRIEVQGKLTMPDMYFTHIWLCLNAGDSDNYTVQNMYDMYDKLNKDGGFTPKDGSVMLKYMEKLIEMGLVIYASSNEELFLAIKDFKVMRNGFPIYDHIVMSKSKELKHILLFNENIPVTKEQLNIWRKADGVKTIGQIYKEDSPDISLSTFIENVIFLHDKMVLMIF